MSYDAILYEFQMSFITFNNVQNDHSLLLVFFSFIFSIFLGNWKLFAVRIWPLCVCLSFSDIFWTLEDGFFAFLVSGICFLLTSLMMPRKSIFWRVTWSHSEILMSDPRILGEIETPWNERHLKFKIRPARWCCLRSLTTGVTE